MKTESVKYDRVSEECTSDIEEQSSKTAIAVKYLDGRVMRGSIASSGVAMGRAVVIKKDDDIRKVKEGSVIISKTASPKLAIVISKVNGIVTENGGMSSIAMGFARENGIPALIGISGLTNKIKDGDVVRVDGIKGILEITEPMMLRRVK